VRHAPHSSTPTQAPGSAEKATSFPRTTLNIRPFNETQRQELQENICHHLRGIAAITSTPPAITRLAYTEFESRALGYIAENAERLGLATSYDQFGNLHCLKSGLDHTLPRVLTGSHIDSVKNAGRFDGIVGVVGALESLRLMGEMGITPQRDLEMIAFRAEESTRFDRATLGSQLLLGKTTVEKLAEVKDSGFQEAFKAVMEKLDPQKVRPWNLKIDEILAFLELHIEQSDVLYELGIPLGLVSVIASPERYIVRIKGESTHSGTTPMNKRLGKDAILTASQLYVDIANMAGSSSEDGRCPVATVGDFHSFGGSMNQTAESVEFRLDIRGIERTAREGLARRIKERAERLAAEEKKGNPEFEITFDLQGKPGDPSVLPVDLIRLNERLAEALWLNSTATPSYAGHDAQIFASLGIPTAMIFIQNRECVSHNPNEYADLAHIVQGTELLFHSLLNLAT